MLAGISVMTAIVLVAVSQQKPFIPKPGILSVGDLAAFCSGCKDGEPCIAAASANLFCLGVITGVMDSSPELGRLCLPEGWDTKHAESIFVTWSRTHPGSKDIPASEGIVRAQAASFDCRKSRGGV